MDEVKRVRDNILSDHLCLICNNRGSNLTRGMLFSEYSQDTNNNIVKMLFFYELMFLYGF